MTNQRLAYCGLDCSQCPAYLATQANDIGKLILLAQEWFDGSTDHNSIRCDGCSVNGSAKTEHQLTKWCAECPTRSCATTRTLENCAYCADFGCEKLLMVFKQSPEARTNLDNVRASL